MKLLNLLVCALRLIRFGRIRRVAPTVLALSTALWLAACGGDGGIGGTGISGEGTLRVSLTDAPACGYDQVHITVERVRVHQVPTAADADDGWREIVLAPPRRIDLLTLTNGTLEPLGATRLPAGTYTQMRLVLADNRTAPLANAVTPSGQPETALTTPSGPQSGLKLATAITVPAGQEAEVVIDFDACRSVVRAGNSGQYLLKPVLRVTAVLRDAGQRITGWVEAARAATSRVSAQQGGVEIAATRPRADGSFTLYPLASGTYDLVIGTAGRPIAVVTGVPVVDGTPTPLFSDTAPFAAAAAASGVRNVAGQVSVGPGLDRVDAVLRVTQTLTGGRAVQVDAPSVDADSGAFTTTLSIDPPQVAAHAAPGTDPTFVPDSQAAGRYRVQARLGSADAAADIDVTSPVPDLQFTFP